MNTPVAPGGKELTPELRSMLMSIGRGLGTVSVYGPAHPSVEQIVSLSFDELQKALANKKKISIGTFNGALAVDGEPVNVKDIPIRTLERRLVAMKISHLSLQAGLSKEELKNLLAALCAPSGEKMKETLSGAAMSHVALKDVKYVALHEGEEKTGKGGGKGRGGSGSAETEEIPPAQIQQIIAFLKGNSGDPESNEALKQAVSDPEKLGQMIMEAASIRQAGTDVQAGESLADIVIGCLRRTYDGLRKEKDFQSARGKANLAKAMMLLEKNVLDKIHHALGKQNPQIDKRIIDAIREMEEDRQFDLLTTHYFNQSQKLEDAEKKIIAAIQKQGAMKAKELFEDSGLPPSEWQRLMVAAGAEDSSPKRGGGAGGGEGGSASAPVDLSALAVVLEKLDHLMDVDQQDPEVVKEAVSSSQEGIMNYTDRIESRIQELEGQIDVRDQKRATLDAHADHLEKDDLLIEVSNLTMALIQPLTVVNASVESAMKTGDKDLHEELLQLAHVSGERMESLTKRMMKLVGYPTLDQAHLPQEKTD